MGPQKIILPLRAVNFAEANYMSNESCPIAIASNHLFKTRGSMEYCTSLFAKGRKFLHDGYYAFDFYKDLETAKQNKFDSTIIREIELTEVYD